MHIILMIALILGGFSLGSNVSWLLGLPTIVVGILCFNLGSSEWRERQEAYLFTLGIGSGALILLYEIFR